MLRLFAVNVVRIDGERRQAFYLASCVERIEEYVMEGRCETELIEVVIRPLDIGQEELVEGGEVPGWDGWRAGWIGGEALTYCVLS